MNKVLKLRWAGFSVVVLAVSTVVLVASGQRREQPPEVKEYVAAVRIEDPEARIQELERIIAAYPDSRYRASMEMAVVNARIEMATEIESVFELQKPFLAGTDGISRLSYLGRNASQILDHHGLAAFDKGKTVEIVLGYVREGLRLAADSSYTEKIPADERRYLSNIISNLILTEARALVFAGNSGEAGKTLDAYDEVGGPKTSGYHYLRAEIAAGTGRKAEAVQAYLKAAANGARGFSADAAAKAEALHLELGGTEAGFEAELERTFRELPFHPEPFAPSREWKGKTVLFELFTGSECPPCVAADLGFDGILEAYGLKYAAVLEYHVPIPGPDPMMNPASGQRRSLYGINSAPTVVIDGESRQSFVGGGTRAMAETKFNFYASEIMTRTYEEPLLTVKAGATLDGETVKVEFSVSTVPADSDVHVALVQREERYLGSNGLLFHKMVVKDIRTAAPGTDGVSFDLAASERDADAYLTEYEKNNTRYPGYVFPERRFRIDHDGLLVVVFVQDRKTKTVYNTFVTDVRRP